MIQTPIAVSLRERILTASSRDEVEALLLEGAAYKFASASTQSRWFSAAKKTRARLTTGKVT